MFVYKAQSGFVPKTIAFPWESLSVFAESFTHHGLDAAGGQDLHGLIAQSLCLQDFSGLLNGDLAA